MNKSVESKSPTRTLIYIPIIHTQADMGALRDHVKKASLKKLGISGWKRKITLVDKYWTEIDKVIEGLSLPMEGVRIYQDALPVSGKELVIIEELAKSGSRNYALLLSLISKGAVITGTESLELLLEEYDHVKKTLEAESTEVRDAEKSASGSILQRRDKFIAKRISETLLTGEVGLIFLGMLHSLEPWLDKDIRVVYPIHTPFKPGAQTV
ncbi:MAG: hypothetical protein HY912_12180 [Desulfomonile tiedjei]|uniref:Uncharacterized protein n=1 Tax=Desulfomonile tiedjei TaxID=2358 RepID=A0A9D6Z3T8_9BACT|nr:hypothetical protein [Desulfomonile tiedjei]